LLQTTSKKLTIHSINNSCELCQFGLSWMMLGGDLMQGYTANLEDKTLQNNNFRQVLYTGPKSQLVVMSILPGEDIGEEVHAEHDQFIRIEAGTGRAVLNGETAELSDGSAVVIPAGVKHNIINTSADVDLKLYTIYSPPEHPEGTVHVTKADAS